ncbi:MAG: hypothetical protein E7Z88_05170 [Cyanobacteria bacterium SIG27]|nr:hypothetical protein [Cyanobacteria bacterium SIG27]
MKIYVLNNSADRIALFKGERKLENFKPLCETHQAIKISDIIKIKNKTYTVCQKQIDNSYAIIEEVVIPDKEDIEKELWGEDEIKCPVCKNIVMDSWEYEDYDPNFRCSYCGSIFSYERYTHPTYTMILKKVGKPLNITKYCEVQDASN